jgi:hypothetical protein
MKIFSLVICLILTTVFSTNAQSTLALQEKCSSGAKILKNEKLTQTYPYGAANPCVSFQNHYNKNLDRCFIRLGYYFGQEKGEDGLKHPSYGVGLYNVFESSKAIGKLMCLGVKVLKCYIRNNSCESPYEFENLLRPYMEK